MRLDFAQRHTHVNAEDVRMHSHRALELVYYVRGRGKTRNAGLVHAFRRGIFTITPAGTEHDQIDDGPVTSLCFGLLDSGLEPLTGAYRDRDGQLLQTCERILDELSRRDAAWQEMIQGLLYQMVALVRRSASEDGRRPRQAELVDRALSIIRSQDGMITVSELSEHLFVSHDYLRHLFLEHAGQSPMKHIIRVRIERACELLANTDISIADAGVRAGFDNPHYFSRLFRQVTGNSPSAYRRACQTH